jgi:sugar phosphate isomerase/epimerase
MRLATADFGWPLLPHDRVLRLIRLLDIEAVDLGLFAGRSHIRPETVRPDIPMWAGVLKERLERAGLQLADLFVQGAPTFEPMAINHPDRQIQEEVGGLLTDMLELARRLGAPGMTVLPGVRFGDESWTTAIRRSAEALRWWVDAAAEQGIALSVEGHAGSCVDTPEKLMELLDLTPGLTLTLDYTHFTRAGVPDGEIEPLLAHARHFHCRGAAPGKLQTTFGENTIDYRRVIRRLHELGYGGYFAIEYVWIDWEGCNRTENTCETLLFRDLARETLAELASRRTAEPTPEPAGE